MSNSFGEIIRRERTNRKWTLRHLSEATDLQVSPSYINKLEKGEQNNPSLPTVLSLSSALELDIEEVFNSFGFVNIFTPFRRTNTFEQLLRTREIEHPLDGLTGKTILSSFEKEAIINTLQKAFHYVYEASGEQKEEQLIECLKAILEWKRKVDESIRLTSLDLSVSFSLDAQVQEFGNWIEQFERVLETNKEFLKSHDFVNFSIRIGDSEWIIEKKALHLHVIGEKERLTQL